MFLISLKSKGFWQIPLAFGVKGKTNDNLYDINKVVKKFRWTSIGVPDSVQHQVYLTMLATHSKKRISRWGIGKQTLQKID